MGTGKTDDLTCEIIYDNFTCENHCFSIVLLSNCIARKNCCLFNKQRNTCVLGNTMFNTRNKPGISAHPYIMLNLFTLQNFSNTKGPVTRCNFSCNLQRNSTLKRCKFVTNVWYVKSILANCDENMYSTILHLPRVELHCKLQEKLHRVTGHLFADAF